MNEFYLGEGGGGVCLFGEEGLGGGRDGGLVEGMGCLSREVDFAC